MAPNGIAAQAIVRKLVDDAYEMAKDGISFGELLALLQEIGGTAVTLANEFKDSTGEEKKAFVDSAILAVYASVKPFVKIGWFTPLWWIIDPLVVAAVPKITEGVYQLLKPYITKGV